MSNRQLIIIALIAIGILYMMFFVYLIVRATKNNQAQNIYIGSNQQDSSKKEEKNSLTEFFNQSADFAAKMILGKEGTDQYSGVILEKINSVNKMSQDQKNLLVSYIKQMQGNGDPKTENNIRQGAEKNTVPLWFEIFSVSLNKVFAQPISSANQTQGGAKIISINVAS